MKRPWTTQDITLDLRGLDHDVIIHPPASVVDTGSDCPNICYLVYSMVIPVPLRSLLVDLEPSIHGERENFVVPGDP